MEKKEEVNITPIEKNKNQETSTSSTSTNNEPNKPINDLDSLVNNQPYPSESYVTTGTTLLLNNDTKKSNKSIYKMGIYIILAIVFGYFITKTDNNKYKIGLITGFVLFSTFLFNKFFKDHVESHTVSEDNGTNLIEG
jgi:hypothetical protein